MIEAFLSLRLSFDSSNGLRVEADPFDAGDLLLDFFAGSGTLGQICLELDRRFILIDNNRQALEVMAHRFDGADCIEWIGFEPQSIQDDKRQGK